MIDFQNTRKIHQFTATVFMQYMYIDANQTLGTISIFIAGSSLMMATPRKIYDTACKTIILKVFK